MAEERVEIVKPVVGEVEGLTTPTIVIVRVSEPAKLLEINDDKVIVFRLTLQLPGVLIILAG